MYENSFSLNCVAFVYLDKTRVYIYFVGVHIFRLYGLVSDIKLKAIYKVIHTSNYRGGSRGHPARAPPKIEKKMILFGVKS
jgi:hypothetical protein